MANASETLFTNCTPLAQNHHYPIQLQECQLRLISLIWLFVFKLLIANLNIMIKTSFYLSSQWTLYPF